MIPLYILGILLRFGPQHGYQIKKIMEEQLEDFTKIKLPNVYYHLEKMEASGILTALRDKQSARPEKTVYFVGESGAEKFKELLRQTLNMNYRPVFDADAAFYFSEYLTASDFLQSLTLHIRKLEQVIKRIEDHRTEMEKVIPEEMKIYADIIFNHHLMHYKAELSWAEESIDAIGKKGAGYDSSKNN
ncbi:PadR family transcriptional regulator [Lacrimispora xylanisolvens]|uniref:PadR family transcriptional regulator n=1 Tax=Lacrimispora xylanisolvens TaxID=384636 RepID=A0A2S6HVM3_9FIRM|nr:PadR family transcriptional regulator [Hungatella xylanolytica]PPK81992.1 PadR family transcriptional regulator [Hungatella xylanolytica]